MSISQYALYSSISAIHPAIMENKENSLVKHAPHTQICEAIKAEFQQC